MNFKKLALSAVAAAALLSAVPTMAVAEDLVMWERSGGNAGMVDALVAAWNEKNPDRKINLTYIPHTEMVPKLAQSIASGEVPDLMGLDLIYGPQFEAAGQLEDITSYFAEDASIKTASPGHMKVSTFDGKLYGVPLYADVSALFWNKDLFAKAGLDPENPKLSTYADFLQTAQTLTSAGVAPYAINPAPTSEFFQSWFDFYPLYAAQTGGTQLVEDGQATFDDAAGEAVADFWRTIYADQLAGNEQYQGDAFADGQAAMAIVGPWAISVYKDKVNWGSVPVPTENGTAAGDTWTFSDAKNVGLFTACDNKATAWDVLKFATSEEQDGTWLEETGQMPLRKDLTTTYADYFSDNPAYQQFGDQAARTVEVPNVQNSVEIWQAFRDGYSKAVIFGEGDVTTFLTDAKTQIDQLAAGK